MYTIDIEGIDELIKQVKSIDKDGLKRREMLKGLRRQSKPLVKAIRSKAPEAGRTVKRYKKDGTLAATYKSGNLAKSIAIKTGRSKTYPNVLVGPKKGERAKYDGWYGFFVQYGTINQKPNDFIWKGAKTVMPQVTKEASEELAKYIEKVVKKKIKV